MTERWLLLNSQVVTWCYHVWNVGGISTFLFWWSNDNM